MKNQNKWEKLFEEFLDCVDFTLMKHTDVWVVHDRQYANIGDIENFTRPEGGMPPEGFEAPEGFEHPEMPEGNRPEKPFGEKHDMQNGINNAPQVLTPDFVIKDGANMFSNISIRNE